MMLGAWTWIESSGGFGGETIVPNDASTQTLYIDRYKFHRFVNDSLIMETGYELTSAYGWDVVIEYDSGGADALMVEGSRLKLIDLCFDCYVHTYERR